MEEHVKQAEQEDAVDQLLLALVYYEGYHIKENHNKAFMYCKKAAENGLLDAQCQLAKFYNNGVGTEHNPKEAYKWTKIAAEGNCIEAFGQLGYCYEYGIGTEKNMNKALEWYVKAAEEGDVEVQNHLAQEHFDRIKIEETDENKDKILKWARMGAKLGNADAQFKLGVIYYEGKIVEPDHQLAMYWLKKAYEGGKEAAFDVIKEISKANRETTASIDMDTLSGLIVKLEKLKEFYNQSGDLEKVKLACNLVQELTHGDDKESWIPFAQSWVQVDKLMEEQTIL